MKKLLFILFIFLSTFSFGKRLAYADGTENIAFGETSFGVRSTISLFSSSENKAGIGAGWQIRFRLSESLNTEWFADWIVTDLNGLGSRVDAHIGESMIIYPGKQIMQKGRFTPFILGGFCGDYTQIKSNTYFNDETEHYEKIAKERWSFATQLGLGTHYNFTERFDVSFNAQYVLHFGSDIHSEIETNSLGEDFLHIHQADGGGLEGHLFFTISANFKFADFIR
jgi:hypothetical protein